MKVGDKVKITVTGVLTLDAYDTGDIQSITALRMGVKQMPENYVCNLRSMKTTVVALGSKKQGRRKK